MSLPKVCGWGNLAAAPEVTRSAEGGGVRATWRMAFNEKYRDAAGREVKDTTWLDCVAWGRTAAAIDAAGLSKGQYLYVEGKLKQRSTQDEQGQQKTYSDLVVFGASLPLPRVG
jgi:single-strand DNA-binding protein